MYTMRTCLVIASEKYIVSLKMLRNVSKTNCPFLLLPS